MLCVAYSFKKCAKYISFLIQPLQNWHCFQVISSDRWLHLCLEECETSESNHCVCWHTKQGSINRKAAPWHRQRWEKRGNGELLRESVGKKGSLTILSHTRCTTRIRWGWQLGICGTRCDCTFYTGWRKKSFDSEVPGICHKLADCIYHCHVWLLSSSRRASLTSASCDRNMTCFT